MERSDTAGMESSSGEPEILTESDVDCAAETLARAFHDYPVFVYVFPDSRERLSGLRPLFRSFVHHAVLRGEVHATSPDLEGVAVWLPPRQAGGFSVAPRVSQDALDRMAYWGSRVYPVRKRHAPFDHWFLELIGVIPELQGRGYAGFLLAPMLARLDRQGLPCYLDTEVEKNVGIYERHGFRVVDDSVVAGTGIRSWGMLRAGPA